MTRILPELLWIRAIMRRAIGCGDLSRSVDARIYGAGHSIRITTDASPWGIGATLEQDGEFVAYLYDDIQDDDIKRLKITVGSRRPKVHARRSRCSWPSGRGSRVGRRGARRRPRGRIR